MTKSPFRTDIQGFGQHRVFNGLTELQVRVAWTKLDKPPLTDCECKQLTAALNHFIVDDVEMLAAAARPGDTAEKETA